MTTYTHPLSEAVRILRKAEEASKRADPTETNSLINIADRYITMASYGQIQDLDPKSNVTVTISNVDAAGTKTAAENFTVNNSYRLYTHS